MPKKYWCMVCGEEKNPIIKITIGFFNFYLCLKHAIMLYEELGNVLSARKQVDKLYAWAKKEGIEID